MAKVINAQLLERRPDTAYVLSYGGGVNSTALLLLILERHLPLDYIVMADTGDEMPETYAYVDYLSRRTGLSVDLVRSKSGRSLSARCLLRRVIPSELWRWCTRDVKIRPIYAFYKTLGKPVVQYVGFDSKEAERIGKVQRRKDDRKLDITTSFPLYDFGFDRDACVEVITSAKFIVPIKSSCTFCPFKSVEQWVYLYKNHPKEFWAAVKMEEQNKYFPKQKLFVIPLRELAYRIDNHIPLPKSKHNDQCGSL